MAWNQTLLAKAAGLGLSTIYDYENERREVAAESVAKMRKALEANGVEFTNGRKPGVLTRLKPLLGGARNLGSGSFRPFSALYL